MDGDEGMRLITRVVLKMRTLMRDPALSYDEDNPDDEKSEVEAYDAEINENNSRWPRQKLS